MKTILQLTRDISVNLINLDYSLSTSIETLESNSLIIRSETRRITRNGSILSIGIVAFFILTSLFLLLYLTTGMNRGIMKIHKGLDYMKDGHLNRSVLINTKDELMQLSTSMESFRNALLNTINKIKKGSVENVLIKNELDEAIDQISNSTGLLNKNVENINSQIQTLNNHLSDADKQFSTINSNTAELNEVIQKQIRIIETADSSIIEMSDSADFIKQVAETQTISSENLIQTARIGGESLGTTRAIMSEVYDSIGIIEKVAETIKGIASQTNLLAMNAAIEAAHAGEYGKGFSVVADEIRQLAEISAENTNQITSALDKIIERIEKSQKSGQNTQQAFESINREILESNQSFHEIHRKITDFSRINKQIRKDMEELNTVSLRVLDNSDIIAVSTGETSSSMNQINTISSSVLEKIVLFTREFSQIDYQMKKMTRLTRRIHKATILLNDHINWFKTSRQKNITSSEEPSISPLSPLCQIPEQ